VPARLEFFHSPYRPNHVLATALFLMTAIPLSGDAPDVGTAITPPVGAPPAAPPTVVAAPRRPVASSVRSRPWFPRAEAARYDIRYGLLGSIGQLELRTAGVVVFTDGRSIVKLRGSGHGSILGMGSMDRRFEADFDTVALESCRWVDTRRSAGERADQATVDRGERGRPGETRLRRHKPGRADETHALASPIPTMDALGLLSRWRRALPALGQQDVVQILDGMALWRVRATTASLHEAVPESDRFGVLLEAEATPIHYDGAVDGDRPVRHLRLWLDPGARHLPLRMEVPVGPANLVMRLLTARGRI
jgi:hypothetical protein